MIALNFKFLFSTLLLVSIVFSACDSSTSSMQPNEVKDSTTQNKGSATQKLKPISQPLTSTIYTADPSAHVFENKIYIYPSHDIDAGIPENDKGDHFAMRD